MYLLHFPVNTHMHADHITGTGKLKSILPDTKSVIGKASGAAADVHLVDGDVVTFGEHKLLATATPGHTNGCLTYICHEKVGFCNVLCKMLVGFKLAWLFVGKTVCL